MVEFRKRRRIHRIVARILMKLVLMAVFVAVTGFTFVFFYFGVSPERALFVEPLHRFDTNEKIVALTFQGGPNEKWTTHLLDLLQEHSVKATFFVIGEKAQKRPQIVRRMVEEGHLIGSHTYNRNIKLLWSPDYVRKDIRKMDELIGSFGQGNTSYYSAPYGIDVLVQPYILDEMDKTLVSWDVDPLNQYDNHASMNSNLVVKYIMENKRPGSIIFLYDGWNGNDEPWLDAIEKAIVGLKEEGYRFVTIEEGMKHVQGEIQ